MKYSEKIGIVTVLYKSETVLDDFFSTLNQQSYDNFILYLIDNKSPDKVLTEIR
jgi:glycosyltransferase involved in cell wall biosynthesis